MGVDLVDHHPLRISTRLCLQHMPGRQNSPLNPVPHNQMLFRFDVYLLFVFLVSFSLEADFIVLCHESALENADDRRLLPGRLPEMQ